MKKLIALSLIPLFAIAEMAAQSSEILPTGLYDTGRLRSNEALDFHSFNQWNGENDNPGNVGWNTNGIWWSFARFGGDAATHKNPDLFNKLAAADQIVLHLGVLWNEIDSALSGIVAPGVTVGVYLVPGLDIPEGSFPTFPNAWPFSYVNQIKLFEIDPATVPTTNSSWADFGFNTPTEQQRLDNLVGYDVTAGIKDAISQGLLDVNVPWGFVFFNEEALPDLTPNNPDWADKRGTVIDARYMQLELVTGVEQQIWAGYPVDEAGNVDTMQWLGFINVASGDWVWSYTLSKYIYLPENLVGDGGSWTYIMK
ncbi:MAG: hypothetical protein AB3N33_00900 [Puniceicoccaceae bacterium]